MRKIAMGTAIAMLLTLFAYAQKRIAEPVPELDHRVTSKNDRKDKPVAAYPFPCNCVIEPFAGGMLANAHFEDYKCSEYEPVWLSGTTEEYPQYCDSGEGLGPDEDCDCKPIPVGGNGQRFDRPAPPHTDPRDMVNGPALLATRRVYDVLHIQLVDNNGSEVAKFAATQLLFTPRDTGRPSDRLKPPILSWVGVEISDWPAVAFPITVQPTAADDLLAGEYRAVNEYVGQFHARLSIPSRPIVLLIQAQTDDMAQQKQP